MHPHPERFFCHLTLYKSSFICYNSQALKVYAPVAQWIEHRIPVPRVGGSSPFWRTKKEVILSGWPLFWYISWDSKGRRQRSCRKKESGGLFFSPWESPFPFRRIPLGMWMKGKPPCGTALPVRWTAAKRRLDGVCSLMSRVPSGVWPGCTAFPVHRLGLVRAAAVKKSECTNKSYPICVFYIVPDIILWYSRTVIEQDNGGREAVER